MAFLRLTPKSVYPWFSRDGAVVPVMLDVESNQGKEESQEGSLPPGVGPLVMHVGLKEDGGAPDEGGL